jgi:hypothetical protein
MKNFRLNFSKFAVAIAGMLLLCACPDEHDTLTVSKTQLTFEADDTEIQTVTVTTSAPTWNAYSSDSWLKASKSENTISVSVQNNPDTEKRREAMITVEAGDADPVMITVKQNPRTIDNLSIDPVSLSYEANESGDKSVRITTSALSWNATVDASWVSLRKQDNTLWVGVVGNSGPERNAVITITAGNAPEKTVSVTQDGYSGPGPYPFGTSTFTATGTPLVSASPPSWTGKITLYSNDSYYSISKWGSLTLPTFIDYISGKLIIDSSTKAITDNGKDYYFKAVAYNSSTNIGEILSNYEVTYNASTRILNFGGSYDGLPIYVGYVWTDGVDITMAGGYSDVKFVLTPVSSAPVLDGNNALKSNLKSSNGDLLRTDQAVTFKKASSIEDLK